jgi:hypothetical protein
VAAACLVTLVCFLGVLVWWQSDRPNNPSNTSPRNLASGHIPAATIDVTPKPSQSFAPAPENVAAADVSKSSDDQVSTLTGPSEVESIFANDPPLFRRSVDSAPPSEDEEIVAFVDQEIRRKWKESGIAFVEHLKNREWLDRVFLKLLGRRPSDKERDEITSQKTRHFELVRRLLTSREYQDEFEAKWSKLLTNLAFNRSESAGSADEIREQFRTCLNEDKPFDQAVRELVVESDLDAVTITHAFSGERLMCASCHHANWESPSTEDRYQQIVKAYGPHRRERELFAEELSRSDAMRESIVNRVWWYFFDYGLTIRDPESGAPQVWHPQMIGRLSREFLASNHDLRKLISWIASSELAFSDDSKLALSSSTNSNSTNLLSRPFRRQYLAESIRGSLTRVADTREVDLVGDGKRPDAIANIPSSSHRGKDGQKVSEDIWQIVEMINRDADGAQRWLADLALLKRISASELNSNEKVAHVFYAAAGRAPSKDEMKAADRILKSRINKPLNGLRDIWWSILMSQEGTKP